MKRFISLLVIFLLSVTATACGGGDDDTGGGKKSINTVTLDPATEVETTITESLKLTRNYEASDDFIEKNIGVVTFSSCVDGDTAHFYTKGGTRFSARYLGIDTPESTIRIEPWGRYAANVMCSILKSAKLIVAEGNSDSIGSAEPDTTSGRYLAHIWVSPTTAKEDLYLSNLYMMEIGLSHNRSVGSKYRSYFDDAYDYADSLGIGVHGQTDPNYDDNPVRKTTIYNLRNNITINGDGEEEEFNYDAKLVEIEGYVTRKQGAAFYLTNNLEGDQLASLYAFGFVETSFLRIGQFIQLEGKWMQYEGEEDVYGGQLTDLRISKLQHWLLLNDNEENDIELEPREILPSQFPDFPASLVTVKNVKLESVPADSTVIVGGKENSAFTIEASIVGSPGTFKIRVDKVINQSLLAIKPSDFGAQDDVITLVGMPSKFHNNYQLMIVLKSDIIK